MTRRAAAPGHVGAARRAGLAAGIASMALFPAPDSPALPTVESIVNARPLGAELVEVDREFKDALSKVGGQLRSDQSDAAVEALHVLIVAAKPVLYPHWEDPRRFVPAGEAATAVLGLLPSDARAAYVRMCGPAARRLYEQGARDQDEKILWRTGRDYFHTPHGAAALSLFGNLAFDRGAFLAAGHAWESVCGHPAVEETARPALLAKAAVAYHMGSAAARAASLRAMLERTAGHARGRIAGQDVPLAAFLADALARPPPCPVAPLPATAWTSVGGSERGAAVMPECAASALALWREPETSRQANVEQLLQRIPQLAADTEPVRISSAIRNGRVRISVRPPGEAGYEFDLPAMVHPVVIGATLIARREQAVVAQSVESGQELWRNEALPVHERVSAGKTPNHYLPVAGDLGRYALAASDTAVYTVGNLRRIDPETYRKFASSLAVDSSTLAALSIADGKLLWEVGCGKGDTEIAQKAKYLAAPAYARGRLYALAKVGNRYHAVCLDASTGSQVWHTPIGPIPTHSGEQLSWQAAYTMEIMTERASPIAVADGCVYLTTNSGLVVALDADTGAPIWAHRYDSGVSGRVDSDVVREVANLAFLISAARHPFPPQNPILVAGGRVLCLPCDGSSLLALHPTTGALLWASPRDGLRDLSAIDERRVLLSGPGLRVVSLADGSTLKHVEAAVADRPAVTTAAVHAAGEGRLVRLDLSDYGTDAQEVERSDSILGRLVSMGGRLMAVNGAGASVYLGFDDAWTSLGTRIEQERDAARRAGLVLQRGILALRAGRFEPAEQQLRAAARAAEQAGERDAATRIRPWLYQAMLRRAQNDADDAAAGRHLEEARRLATGPEQAVAVAVAGIAYHERFGRPGKAAEAAEDLASRHADAPVSAPGAGAAGPAWVPGRIYGHQQIARLIREHGPGCYAAQSRELEAAWKRGRDAQDADAVLEAWARRPEAECADQALFSAAEILHRRARASSPPDPALVVRAGRVLDGILNYPLSPLRVPALAAHAWLDCEFRPTLSDSVYPELRAALTNRVVFDGMHLTVSNVLAELNRQPVRLPAREVPFAWVDASLRVLFRSDDARMGVLREPDGRPVQAGPRVFLHGEQSLACVDSRRTAYRDAVQWVQALPDAKAFPSRVGHLSTDLRFLALAGNRDVALIDATDGREVARHALGQLGVSSVAGAAADGDRLVVAGASGGMACLNLGLGAVEWKQSCGGLDAGSVAAGCDVLHWARGDRSAGYFLDLRTGRQIREVTYRQRGSTSTRVNGDGFGFSMETGRRVEFHDPRREDDGNLGGAALDGRPKDALAFGYRLAALKDQAAPHRLYFVDIAAPSRLHPVALESGGQTCAVARVVLDDMAAYALGSASTLYGKYQVRPRLAAYDLDAGTLKVRWQAPALDESEEGCVVLGPALYGRFLSVVLTPRDETQPSVCLFLDGATGQVAVRFVLPQDATDVPGTGRRVSEWAGPGAILNGRAVVEFESGVYGLAGKF